MNTGNLYRSIAAMALLMLAVAGCGRSLPPTPAPDLQVANSLREALGGGVVADGGDGEPVSTGTGWATIRGRFVYDGTPPARQAKNVNKDQAVCAPGGVAPLSQALLVDESTKGIANVAIYLRKASRVHESAEPNEDTVLFDQKNCIFLSHVLPVMVGQTLELKNSDPVPHNTNIKGVTNTLIPDLSSSLLKITKEAGTPITTSCSIHPWMQSYILPRKNGYMAITAPDGTFEIANVPAGEQLEFQVWHESAAGSNGALVLESPEAKSLNWSRKGRFKVKLDEGATLDLDLTVPPGAFSG